MKSSKRKWRRCLLGFALIVGIAIAAVVLLVFSRFHFSVQSFPTLARLQGNHLATDSEANRRPEIVGHRGSGIEAGKSLLIGNTSTAIQRGVDSGADWIEIDIRKTRDGHLVVFHDESIDLKTDRQGRVADLDLAQLRDVKVLVDPRESILSLDEVFSKFHAGHEQWILDIKPKGIHEQLIPWLDEQVANETIDREHVILFGTREVLRDYRGAGYPLGFTVLWKTFENRLLVLFNPGALIERCEELGCDYLVLPVIFANSALIHDATEAGLKVWVYGTDDESDLRHLIGLGVSGLIVDHPDQTSKLFDGNGSLP